ncbi:MAG: glycine oxidase ThiO [Gammaproteobacteria bacterium]|nr:glycine oxidase ThiO [Gammaproteobacteria bacterium]
MHAAIAGAGLMGRLMAWRLLRAGWRVSLFERDPEGTDSAAAYTAAGMLAPWAEVESAEELVHRLGLRSLALWPVLAAELGADLDLHVRGTVVVAHAGDRADYRRFAGTLAAKLPGPQHWRTLDAAALGALEPELAGRFQEGLHLPGEAWLNPLAVMAALGEALRSDGVTWHRGAAVDAVGPGYLVSGGTRHRCDWAFDCRGLGARADVPRLRGVRGEVIWLHAPAVKLHHVVRLMHPRYRLYLVPRRDHGFVIGATQIESDDAGPITVRSSLELLSAVYSLHDGFAEARVIETRANCRPAFDDNLPRVFTAPGLVRINGLFRHGFLLAPALAEAVADWLVEPATSPCPELFAPESPVMELQS